MDVVQACEVPEKNFAKAQQSGAQHPGRPGSKRNKISRGAAWSANKCHPPGPRGASMQARHTPDAGQRAFLEKHIRAMLVECTPSGADAARAEACLEELRALVAKVGPEWSLEIFGSLASRFSTSCSDIDATCFEAGGKPWEAHAAARFLREKIVPLLPGHPRLTVTEEVFNAKVPIVRLSFDGKLDIDLSCQNTQALRNTRYLRAYANVDQRVRELGIAVKLWAKGVGVCGASQGHLSSYTFTLMVIYFMQVHPDVLLPCLPTYVFEEGMAGEDDSRVRELASSWSCSLSLAELLARFFWFYTREFMWGHEVASPRLGRRLFARGEQQFTELRGRWATRLHVEDPYKLERNLHHVLGDVEEGRLMEALEQALFAILMGGVPPGLHCTRRAAGDDAPSPAPETSEDSGCAGKPTPAEEEAALPRRAAEERNDSPWEARSRTCSTESGGSCSTESGGEETKSRASPGGSFSNGSSQPSDEDEKDEGGERNKEGAEDCERETEASPPRSILPTLMREAGHADPVPGPAASQKDDRRQPVWFTVQDLEDKIGRGSRARNDAEKRQPVCLRVQDLEDEMGRGPGATAAAALPARPFAALSTNKILSRVSKACMAHAG